jgi:hypothetical protein
VLGVGTGLIGVIEGLSDSTATLMRAPSGWLSDRLRRRKELTLFGYGLATSVKPFLLLASNWGIVLGIRFLDRAGKGIRAAPRDALIADSVGEDVRGRNFGFHRAMDSAGAVLGILGAALVVFIVQRADGALERDTFRIIVVVASVPAVIGLFVLWRFVKEPGRQSPGAGEASGKSANGQGFPLRFKLLTVVLLLFTLGNSSDAFIILRASDLGLSVLHSSLLMAAFNVVYTLLSTPAGGPVGQDRPAHSNPDRMGNVCTGISWLGSGWGRVAHNRALAGVWCLLRRGGGCWQGAGR